MVTQILYDMIECSVYLPGITVYSCKLIKVIGEKYELGYARRKWVSTVLWLSSVKLVLRYCLLAGIFCSEVKNKDMAMIKVDQMLQYYFVTEHIYILYNNNLHILCIKFHKDTL